MSLSAHPQESGIDAEVQLPASSPLQSCPHCEALLDATDREPLETVSCPGCGGALTINAEIAGFQLIEVAGRGGMGVVYKAYDPSLDRHIAIKLLKKEHSADRKLIDQLETEATITASITDPHVVRVYGTGFDNGRFFIAMELVDRGSLDDLIRVQYRVAEAQALEVGVQIAKGLRAAAQHGLIHRDVKPGNILFGDAHTAKIVDFGLALFMSQIQAADSEIWGTPYYLAPEKLDGGAEDVRSDIYSLGASLFHALAGRPPFEAKTATLVALKHLKSQAVSLQAFAPWVSNPTAYVINKTLAKNPSDRYQSYDDLIHNMAYALEQLQTGGAATQSRARVVLETDDDRKNWTWMVLGMVATIVVLLIVFVSMRPKAQTVAKGKQGLPSPATTVVAAKRSGFENELTALVSRDEKAGEIFRTLAANNAASAADRSWAPLLEGVSHLLVRRVTEARSAFARVGASASRAKDPELAAFLSQISQQLAKSEPVPVEQIEKLDRRNYQAIGYFLHGLNSLVNDRQDDGTSFLRQFRSTTPEGSVAWIGELKPLATILVEEAASLKMGAEQLKNARSTEDRIAVVAGLRKLGSTFSAQAEALISPYSVDIQKYQDAIGKVPGPGIYRIINKHTNKCMDVHGHGKNPGAKIVQWEYVGGGNQMWEVMEREEGVIGLRSVHSKLFLDLPSGSKTPEVNAQIWTENDAPAEKWRIEPQNGPWFYIRSMASDQVLGVFHMKQENGTPITQWDKPGTADHFWRFEPVGTRVGEWVSGDIGRVSKSGDTLLNGGALTMTANSGDVWGKEDSFRFTFQEVDGDFDISARMLRAVDVEDYNKMGLMVRSGAVPNAPAVFVSLAPRKGVTQQVRTSGGGEFSETPRIAEVKPPCWLKLSRRGEEFSTFYSTNGVNWTQIGSEKVPAISKEATVGLAVCSQHHKAFTAEFDQIALSKP